MQWNKEIANFFVQGRHLNVNVFITTQHVKGLGPVLRKNCDVVVLQPIFDLDARKELFTMYGGITKDKDVFFQLMDEIVIDENLPGSTPQEPKKRVRTMFVSDFENTTNPQMKFHWNEADDPGEFRMLADEYWKEHDNNLAERPAEPDKPLDVVAELEQVSSLMYGWDPTD